MTQQAEPRRSSRGQTAYEWWRDNCKQPSTDEDGPPRKYDPAIRAKLRRCHSNTEAASIRAVVVLAERLQALRKDPRPFDPAIDAALGLARVLAYVVQDIPEAPMRAAGWKRFPGADAKSQEDDVQPVLSETRFRRLLGVESGEEQVTAFIRLVKLLGGRVNVAQLSRDFLHWNNAETRKRWAFDYYHASFAAPTSNDTTPSEATA